jgi:hypothetical protein
MAHFAVDKIAGDGSSERVQQLEDILTSRDQLYRFASVFPDSHTATNQGQGALLHSPVFLDTYAQAIHEECFTEPIGFFCGQRPDIPCVPVLDPCLVRGSNVCTIDLTNCNVAQGDFCGIGSGVCFDQGVCTSDYTTKCAVGGGFQCPGFDNVCVANYGLCLSNTLSNKCERLVTHFMGSLAHLAADAHADKFFLSSVSERVDCPGIGDPANIFTDQDMDPYLGEFAEIPGVPDPGLAQFVPTNLITGRNAVEETFLEQVLFDAFGGPSDLLSTLLTAQWIAIREKMDSANGGAFRGFACSIQPAGADCTSVDKDEREAAGCLHCNILNPVSCLPFNGVCETLRQQPRIEDCEWAFDDDNWYWAGGGVDDTAKEIATIMRKAWLFMRDGMPPKFRFVGSAGDRHLCVGYQGGPDCLEEKTLQVLGADGSGGKPDPQGTLSDWSGFADISDIEIAKGSGQLRFFLYPYPGSKRVVAPPLPEPECIDDIEERTLVIELGGDPQEIERLTDILFTSFIELRRVQVRVDSSRCSDTGHTVVRDIRLQSDEVIADAGPDQTLECEDPSGAQVLLDGTESTAPDPSLLMFSWSAAGIEFDDPASETPSARFPKGTTTATLEVSDASEVDLDDVDIQVVDSTAPTVVCPDDIEVECSESGGPGATAPAIAAFLSGANATDSCDTAPSVSSDAPGRFGPGDTVVTFTARDSEGNTSECTAVVTVRDTARPVLSVSLDPDQLWPPSNEMCIVDARVSVEDVCDPLANFTLAGVVSREAGNARGSGDTTGDIDSHELGTPDTQFRVRGERSGLYDRIYTATYAASDASGNPSMQSVEVRVPAEEPAPGDLFGDCEPERQPDRACGIGFELALLLPLLVEMRRRRTPAP